MHPIQFRCPSCESAVLPTSQSAEAAVICSLCKSRLKLPPEGAQADALAAHDRILTGLASLGLSATETPIMMPLQFADPGEKPWLKKVISCLVLLICLATWFTPWGVVNSTLLGIQKGSSLCAFSGCTKPAEVQVGYGPGGMFTRQKPETHVGFCAAHADKAPQSISIPKGRDSFFVFLVFLIVAIILPVGYIINSLVLLNQIFRRKYKAFRSFFCVTTFGLALNGVAYVYWLYFHWSMRH